MRHAPKDKRIFTFNSGILGGINQGYDPTLLSPNLATDGRNFTAFSHDITGADGYIMASEVDGECLSGFGHELGVVVASGGNLLMEAL